MQCVFRGYRSRVAYQRARTRETSAANLIQRTCRVYLGRIAYQRAATWESSVVIIQRVCRGYLFRVAYLRLHAALSIQRLWRGHMARLLVVGLPADNAAT